MPRSFLRTEQTAEPHDWAGIGSYLGQQRVQLLSNEVRTELREAWEDITRQEENLDDAILIGLVGGTGVGKSTLINALAGQEVSRSSDRRPTTDRVIVYRHVNTDLSGDIPSTDFAQPEVLHDNGAIEKVVLFDFPDFDSAETSHTQIIRRYLPYLDVLLVVVDDVKYADRRLYELLAQLEHDPQNIFVLLNKIDRLQHRYADRSDEVIQELLNDLDGKLRSHSDLQLKPQQMFPIAAQPVYDARCQQEPSPEFERFEAVERLLEGYQVEKHRRAAKERNLEARKRELTGTLLETALGKENEAVLAEAKTLVRGWRGELENAIVGIPVDVLTDAERRAVRGARLRQAGPRWGVPFSLWFTLLGEFRRRGTTPVEPTEIGHRVMAHYRGFFEAIKNVHSRFATEFRGSRIQLSSLNSQASSRELVGVPPTEIAAELRAAVQHVPAKVPRRRVLISHAPGLLALVLAFWGKLHPILESALGNGESGVIWTSLTSLVSTLSPTFLVGTLLTVLFVYAMTALVIWLREVQKLDQAISTAEQHTREAVRQCGEQAVDQLDQDVRGLYDEFEQLQKMIRLDA